MKTLDLILILGTFFLFSDAQMERGIEHYERLGNYQKALEIAQENPSQSTIDRLQTAILDVGALRLLFDENDKPRAQLLELLHLVGMAQSIETISEINEWTQKNLLRRGERWDEQTSRFEALKPELYPLLTDLGFINGISAHFNAYQGAVVQGALLTRVRLRLHYLIEQWNRGVRFNHLYFLSGERPLEPLYENQELLIRDDRSPLKIRNDWIIPTDLPKTEYEMMRWVWEQAEVPQEMRTLAVYFINAPMKTNSPTGKLTRPAAEDTVLLWVASSPPHGRYLAISNSPYINRQDCILRSVSPKEYQFDTIGPRAADEQKMSIILDEIARTIYTHQLAKKQSITMQSKAEQLSPANHTQVNSKSGF